MVDKKTKRVAIGLLVDGNDRVLMGKRNDTDKFTVPAGHIEELKEETGLDAKEVKLVQAGMQDGILLYLFKVKVCCDQKIDASNDPDNECDDWTYEDPFDHIEELHIPAEKNIAIKFWANN
jgi:8-oxo-dGTP pyrophosphatase MutT (NUDIX family)